jgi:hypothetical protein
LLEKSYVFNVPVVQRSRFQVPWFYFVGLLDLALSGWWVILPNCSPPFVPKRKKEKGKRKKEKGKRKKEKGKRKKEKGKRKKEKGKKGKRKKEKGKGKRKKGKRKKENEQVVSGC